MDNAVLLMLSKHLPGVGFNKHQLLPNPLKMYSFFVFYCMFFLFLGVQNKFQINQSNLSSFHPLSFLTPFRLPPTSVVPSPSSSFRTATFLSFLHIFSSGPPASHNNSTTVFLPHQVFFLPVFPSFPSCFPPLILLSITHKLLEG